MQRSLRGRSLLPDLIVDLDRSHEVLGGKLQPVRRSAGVHAVRNLEAGDSLEATLLAGDADGFQPDRHRLAARILASELTEKLFELYRHRAQSVVLIPCGSRDQRGMGASSVIARPDDLAVR